MAFRLRQVKEDLCLQLLPASLLNGKDHGAHGPDLRESIGFFPNQIIYRNMCLLYNRLAAEYQEIIFIYEGELPEHIKSKIEKIYSVGEMISTFQAISKMRESNDGYGCPDEWD